ncbi:hypothetical protein Y032_1446g3878, partial [Ancylostoma ceylanicum]
WVAMTSRGRTRSYQDHQSLNRGSKAAKTSKGVALRMTSRMLSINT